MTAAVHTHPTSTSSQGRRLRGFITQLESKLGYGFLSVEGEKRPFFFHRRALPPEVSISALKLGHLLDFTPIDMTSQRAAVGKWINDRAIDLTLIG